MSTTTRRGFVATIGGLVAALSAVVVTPALSLLLDPGPARADGESTRACGRLRDLRPGVPRKVEIFAVVRDAWSRSDSKPIGGAWLVRRDPRRVDAFSSVCPHLGCAIDFDPARRRFVCPCHQGEFSMADGACLSGPSPRGLDPLAVKIEDDKVVVTFVRYVLGIATRRRS